MSPIRDLSCASHPADRQRCLADLGAGLPGGMAVAGSDLKVPELPCFHLFPEVQKTPFGPERRGQWRPGRELQTLSLEERRYRALPHPTGCSGCMSLPLESLRGPEPRGPLWPDLGSAVERLRRGRNLGPRFVGQGCGGLTRCLCGGGWALTMGGRT